ncbi:GXWXG domain-containing protein [Blastococcus sp. TF02A-26]|uniref:GXWXG domain-containing protein n=1 Tax=Blastococcus sp. TF02A-26 TaxID=2250577 RepID=UPI000DE9647F|nr:GXWXG domain-containing protein [Blastococcus sp. TF02A-26]RBY90767.1 DUF4334 domain-containing protein [Blastococcus sp. TF02A-26]
MSAAGVLALFDSLDPVAPAELVGRWRGAELPTGSRLDGLLPLHGWWGKEVLDPETVHPLLFADRSGRPHPVAPWPAPLGLLRRAPGLARTPPARAAFAAARPLLRARRPGARVRTVTVRGVATAAIVYDALPVVDAFRRVDERSLLGLMDMRGLDEPFAFVLVRDPEG